MLSASKNMANDVGKKKKTANAQTDAAAHMLSQKHANMVATVNTVEIHWGITNPLTVGQRKYVCCRSHADPAAHLHCFMLCT